MLRTESLVSLMTIAAKRIGGGILAVVLGIPAVGQSVPGIDAGLGTAATAAELLPSAAQTATAPGAAVEMLRDFRTSDVKFDLNQLLDILRDHRHEGWVLAAYPDPKTSQPLIGAGFSLDLPERAHPQLDPMNPHAFLEPSSAELWQAAGFDPARLDAMLDIFHQRKSAWSKKMWRRQIKSLPPQISDDEAMQLVRVGAIQAIYNAKAYCRNFDQLSASQQMALAQLVYQMGVNLEEFSQFLGMINPGAGPRTAAMAPGATAIDLPSALDQTPAYWTGVQKSLIESQWARLYRTRAISVIAMLDPAYGDDPTAAERRVSVTLRPAVVRRGRGHGAAIRQVSIKTHRGRAHKAGRSARTRSRKRA
jgi:hypothetical protein